MDQQDTALTAETDASGAAGEKWLSGNAVLRETGIAKNDLIRFIQLGVLPKAMMCVAPDNRDRTRKKSYFAPSIIGHVAVLKRLRDAGHSVEEIAGEMQAVVEDASPEPDAAPASALSPTSGIRRDIPPQVQLRTDSIAGAAFFVDHDLRIGWIKASRGDRLFNAIEEELADDPSGTVLDIMLRASLKELVFDWPPLFSFTYRFLQATTPTETFNRLAPTVSLNQDQADQPDGAAPITGMTGFVDSCPMRLPGDDGQVRSLRFYGIAVAGGAIFTVDEDRWQEVYPRYGMRADAAATAMGADITPHKTPFSVLSARLDDSRSIVDTLLPDTFFQLMTRIWDACERVVTTYGGQRAKRSGTEGQYIIPKRNGTDPAYDAIRCAFDIRQKVRKIEASLRAEGGWFADIRLNIGISSGSDHLRAEDLTASMAFMLPGGAADQAYALSAIAHGGAIWITKSAFGHLSPRQMNRITFGIYRDDRLIRNIFAPVSDLPHAPDTPPLGRGIRSLSVTRIIDLQPA